MLAYSTIENNVNVATNDVTPLILNFHQSELRLTYSLNSQLPCVHGLVEIKLYRVVKNNIYNMKSLLYNHHKIYFHIT
jgi:hypothetical protein